MEGTKPSPANIAGALGGYRRLAEFMSFDSNKNDGCFKTNNSFFAKYLQPGCPGPLNPSEPFPDESYGCGEPAKEKKTITAEKEEKRIKTETKTVIKEETAIKTKAGKTAKETRSVKETVIHCAFFCAIIIFLELTLHYMFFTGFSGRLFYLTLFCLPIGQFCALITGFFREKVNRIISWILITLIIIFYVAQFIYYAIFGSFMSLFLVGMGGEAITSFWRETISTAWNNLPKIIVFFVPLICYGVLCKFRKLPLRQVRLSLQGGIAVSAVAIHFLTLAVIGLGGTGAFSAYALYHSFDTGTDISAEAFGILTTTRLEFMGMLGGGDGRNQEDIMMAVPVLNENMADENTASDSETDTSPNILDIDFAALAQRESNSNVKSLHEYFAMEEKSCKNQYTGLFEGYNLITICAESFSTAAINPECTPTLYKLAHEGFKFNNYYNSFLNNTSNGEYSFNTGLYPDFGREKKDGSLKASINNWLPFTLGNVFSNQAENVTPYAYHNYKGYYYERRKTHPNMGYFFKATDSGLNMRAGWPSSDLIMMQKSVDDYINDKRFHTYYMTFSGHYQYDFDKQDIARKNKPKVSNLPLSDTCKAYLASQIELDMALEYLLQKLEEAGAYENTVIVLAADHFPYGLKDKEYASLLNEPVDADFGKYKDTLIVWSGGMKEQVEIDNPCCNVDILPTILNLFGFEYDSRLLAGRDILSTATHIAILSNQSFVTKEFMFNSRSNKVTYFTDEAQLPEDYVKDMIQIVKNRLAVSTKILNLDYYRYVTEYRPSPTARCEEG